MSKVRVNAFTISIDGYGAGPHQTREEPLGVGGESLHGWMVNTKTFRKKVMGKEDGDSGIDDDFTARGFQDMGAWILGRNMFAPSRGPWPDDNWKGWWGKNPPYHVPTFILTHHPRESIEMEGGTVFHFVTGGIQAALERAREAAGDRDIRVGGGVSTIREFLQAGLIDEIHLAISPIVLGSGEHLLTGIDLPRLGYRCVEQASSPRAMHVVFAREAAG
jgi:dihydrofolate reductase